MAWSRERYKAALVAAPPRKGRRLPRQSEPMALARNYYARINRMREDMIAAVRHHVVPVLEELAAGASRVATTDARDPDEPAPFKLGDAVRTSDGKPGTVTGILPGNQYSKGGVAGVTVTYEDGSRRDFRHYSANDRFGNRVKNQGTVYVERVADLPSLPFKVGSTVTVAESTKLGVHKTEQRTVTAIREHGGKTHVDLGSYTVVAQPGGAFTDVTRHAAEVVPGDPTKYRITREVTHVEGRALKAETEAAKAIAQLAADPGAVKAKAELGTAIDAAQAEFREKWSRPRMAAIAEPIAREVPRFNASQMNKQLSAAIGQTISLDIVGSEGWVANAAAEWLSENVALIKSIPDQFFPDLEKYLSREIADGVRWEEMAETIQDRYDVTESRAKLIARDQVNKYNGDLARVRQGDLGVTRFIWRTVGDERVRDDETAGPNLGHAERNGKSYAWNDPPEGETPGEPIQCRCWAEPDTDSIAS